MTSGLSLKAANADSFYYPPEWTPKQGSLDSFQRKKGFEHALGKSRTKNLDKGVLVIRFEIPFKVQCLNCENFIGIGTRFDADKKCVGQYHSTKIWEFSFKCGHIVDPTVSRDKSIHCNNDLVIRTDPRNCDYELAQGLHRVVVNWDPKDSGTYELPDTETRQQMQQDPMFKLEQTMETRAREVAQKKATYELQKMQVDMGDSYSLNSALRKRFRTEKKIRIEAEKPKNFVIPLVNESPRDIIEAKKIKFRAPTDKVLDYLQKKRRAAEPMLPSGGARLPVELEVRRARVELHRHISRTAAASSSQSGTSSFTRNAAISSSRTSAASSSRSAVPSSVSRSVGMSSGRTATPSNSDQAAAVAKVRIRSKRTLMAIESEPMKRIKREPCFSGT